MNGMITQMDEAFKYLKEVMGVELYGWDAARFAVKDSLEAIMEGRRDDYLMEANRQGVKDRRNGYYSRTITTRVGDLVIDVPRTRKWAPRDVLKRYARKDESIVKLILSAFLLGLSTRHVGVLIKELTGVKISAATVSNTVKVLDGHIKSFHRRKLEDKYSFLMLDGIVVKEKTGSKAVKKTILVAVGIGLDGKREVIDYTRASSESSTSWRNFLLALERRGLSGKNLKMITVDGNKGLWNAVGEVYFGVSVQHCWAHRTRNIVNDKTVKVKDRMEMRYDLKQIWDANGYKNARKAAKEFADKWNKKYPKAVRQLQKDLDELLAFYKLDKQWWKTIRTTNIIERVQREIRRRFRPIGAAYNDDSLDRIVFAALTAKKFEWEKTKIKVEEIIDYE